MSSLNLRNALKQTLREVDDGKILTPITRSSLLDPQFKGFNVKVEPWRKRPYDGWFHPSEHATWTPRQLFLYLTRPEIVEQEQMHLTSVIAITQGHFFHTFLQNLWLKNGILLEAERSLVDEIHHRKGHTDGLLDGEALEIKTINDRQLPKIFDTASLREKKPAYFAQGQDYLDMSGMPRMRYFFIATSYPYPSSEFVVERDEQFQQEQRLKYRQALDTASAGKMPSVCCPLRSAIARSCPVRGGCEIGLAS